MPFSPTAFHRLLEPLDRREVRRVVSKHRGDHGVGHGEHAWTCQRHLKALLFAQFAGLEGLRGVVQGLAAQPKALYHLGLRLPRRSTLADALSTRPAAVFGELCSGMIGMMAGSAQREGKALVELLDASPIPLRDDLFPWAEADARCRGLKLHVLYDPRAQHPVHFALTSPRVGDLTVAQKIEIAAGTTYVFDKGYTSYTWWQHLVDAKALFVTRLKCNVRRREECENPATGANILADNTVKIGHKKPRGGAENPLFETRLREITVAREGKAPLRLITNDHQRSAVEIADLYKERWQIELFFKWIKQNLKIKKFLGCSENAVKTQIFVALLAFILLRMFQTSHASSHRDGPKALLTRLKVALLDPFDLTNRTKPPPKPPQNRSPSPQFSLNLAGQ